MIEHHSPQIIEQSGMKFLKLRVPSKSTPDPRTITYFPSGKHFCDCPGHAWKVKRGTFIQPNQLKWCRHHSMTTLKVLELFKDRIYIYINSGQLEAAWKLIGCQRPDFYQAERVHCTDCPLYPDVCNIHPIRARSRNRKPLVWRLQTAIFNHRKKDAKRLFRKYCKAVKGMQHESDTRGNQEQSSEP